jgi:hypothetical protein
MLMKILSALLVNEVALVVLFGLLGWKVAALYLGTEVKNLLGCLACGDCKFGEGGCKMPQKLRDGG